MHPDYLQSDCMNKATTAVNIMRKECQYDLALKFGGTPESYVEFGGYELERYPAELCFIFYRQSDDQEFKSMCTCLPGCEFSHVASQPPPPPTIDDEDVRTVKRRRVNLVDSLSTAVEHAGRWLFDQNGVDRRPNH